MSNQSEGLTAKEKKALRDKKYRERNHEAYKAKERLRYAANREKLLEKRKERYAANPEHFCGRMREYRVANIGRQLLAKAKKRAKLLNVPFDLSESDVVIPSHCPVLGIPIVIGTKGFSPNSPSLDRIVCESGYVKGNVAVISLRANKIKSDATLEELQLVVKWLSRQ